MLSDPFSSFITPQATPIQEIIDPLLQPYGVRLLLKRLDRVHPVISGNKWFKLKYNLAAARDAGADTLLSFGGAFSNHIYALAGAGKACGFRTIGVIRGEPYSPLNSTLQFATEQGMLLHYLNRNDYRQKHSDVVIDQLKARFGKFYLIPEGGTNHLAVQGCAEILQDVQAHFDVVACACGTGGTLAGLITSQRAPALGIAVLKGATFLQTEVANLLPESNQNWQIEYDYHHGGYAKTTPALLAFTQRFEQLHGIPLDHVYTGKLLFALYEMITQQRFARGQTVLAVHTGGLRGMI